MSPVHGVPFILPVGHLLVWLVIPCVVYTDGVWVPGQALKIVSPFMRKYKNTIQMFKLFRLTKFAIYVEFINVVKSSLQPNMTQAHVTVSFQPRGDSKEK